MCPKTVVQNKIIREEKKDLILRTALKVFAQEGYHASSVNKIADKANISKGLIYNYFESKEDLLNNIVSNIMDRYMEKYPPIDSIPNDSHIEYFIDQSFEFILEDKARAKLLFALTAQSIVMDLMTKITMQKAEPFMNNVMNFFEIKKYDDPEGMMHYFFSTLEGVQLHVTFNPLYPIDKVKKILKKQFLKS
ncbi:MAG: TetR/AcrR family transcriptional regulator [Flavobacteriales bacterium]|tara:strand:- start:1889 stop:2464 length:576 start_codon:yes stop_codon:yes gene_type:complete